MRNSKWPGTETSMIIRLSTILTLLFAAPLVAQNYLGTWQGTLHSGDSNLRIVIEIVQPSGAPAPLAHLYSPDQTDEGMHADTLSLNGNQLHLTLTAIGLSYDATLSPDGQTLDGTLTQGEPSKLKLIRTTGAALWIDPKIHGVSRLVSVAPGVRLEVVDWGGTGRALVLLSGLGNTAHIYDSFAQKLTPRFHVVGITRRGFGDSSIPTPSDPKNYTADRLGDDVIAVIAALDIHKPVLIDHSIAGEELSSVASRHPETVAALVYLEAGFPYAFYDPAVGDLTLDLLDFQRRVAALLPGGADPDPSKTISALEALLPALERNLSTRREMLTYMPPPPPVTANGSQPISPSNAILLGEHHYTHISSPVLAIFAVPHDLHSEIPNDPSALANAEAIDKKRMSSIAESFAKGVPQARVVRLANASHFVFLSNEADVLREIFAFLEAHP